MKSQYFLLLAAVAAIGCGKARERDPSKLEPGKIVFEQRFGPDFGKPQIWDYNNLLTYGVTNVNGESFFRMTNNTFPKDNKYAYIDTAFSWKLPGVFKVDPGSEIAVVVEARGHPRRTKGRGGLGRPLPHAGGPLWRNP